MARRISLTRMNSSAEWLRLDSPGPSFSAGEGMRAWSLSVGAPEGGSPLSTGRSRTGDPPPFLQGRMTACRRRARSSGRRAARIPADHTLVRACLERGRKPYGSPPLSDQALMAWPSLKMGPGDSARSHSADEYIGLDEMAEALDLYIGIISDYDYPQLSANDAESVIA